MKPETDVENYPHLVAKSSPYSNIYNYEFVFFKQYFTIPAQYSADYKSFLCNPSLILLIFLEKENKSRYMYTFSLEKTH